MWSHLLERPEGITEFGPQALSQRLSRFLSSQIAPSLYSPAGLGVMRQFAEHYGKLAPLPNTTNPSGSATTAAKLVRGMGRHIFSILGFGGGHVTGALVGHGIDTGLQAVKTARQLEKTKELFLGKKQKGAISPNYERRRRSWAMPQPPFLPMTKAGPGYRPQVHDDTSDNPGKDPKICDEPNGKIA
jgi:hypothetical protein